MGKYDHYTTTLDIKDVTERLVAQLAELDKPRVIDIADYDPHIDWLAEIYLTPTNKFKSIMTFEQFMSLYNSGVLVFYLFETRNPLHYEGVC